MSDGRKELILVVDDDNDSRRLTERVVQNAGYEVMSASGGREALLMVKETVPDLILLDVTMPQMNGYQVCARLQDDPETAYIPVVFLTGHDEQRDKAKAFSAGAADYLIKPIKREALVETVKTQLENKYSWYDVKRATDLWDEAPLPQKFAQFRDLLIQRMKVAPDVAQKIAKLQPAEIYRYCDLVDITEKELAQQMADFFGLGPVAWLEPTSIQLGVLPTTFCRSHYVVAVRDENGENAFVLANPFTWDLDELDLLNRAFRGQPYKLLITSRKVIANLFFDSVEEESAASPRGEVEVVTEKKTPLNEILAQAYDASPVEIVNALIADAVGRGASDLHIEPEKANVRVRYRVDGRMRSVMPLQKQNLNAVVARIKVMCNMDMTETRKPQDGGCTIRLDHREVELRVSTLPGTQGEIVVLRILGQNKGFVSLDRLGFGDDMLHDLKRLLAARQGMILITGPTGSGKTTTLYAGLAHLNKEDVNIVTVEDPVEIDFEGINQVQVHDQAGRTFAGTLRSMLRQDPDIIMVGEIRDLETAEIACRAALTGHLVMSTLHTQHTLGTLARLFDMGVAPYLAASALNGVLAQRLVKRVCDACAEPYDPPAGLTRALEEQFGSIADAQFRKGKGCIRCLRTGTKGRVGVYELLVVDDDLRHMMVTNTAPSALREYLARRHFRTMEQDAFLKACQGEIPPEEIAELGFSLSMVVDESDLKAAVAPAPVYAPELAAAR